jgi:hypothetical protein
MMLVRCSDPNAIGLGLIALVSQDQNDLLAYVNRRAAEERLSNWKQRFQLFQDEVKRNLLFGFGVENRFIH